MYYHPSIISQKSIGKKDERKKNAEINVPQKALLLSFYKNGSEWH